MGITGRTVASLSNVCRTLAHCDNEFANLANFHPPGHDYDQPISNNGGMDRERDAAGRAANARPRDQLGRPLPPGSPGIERIPDTLRLTPAETLARAQELLDKGLAFTAHEIFEAAWKSAPEPERSLWQGLAQFAVGLTHIQRGNPRGAQTVLSRGLDRIAAFDARAAGFSTSQLPYGLDRGGLLAHGKAILAALEGGETISEDRLPPRLLLPR